MKIRTFLLLACLYACFSKDGHSQTTKITPDCTVSFSFTTAGQRSPSGGFNNNLSSSPSSCVYWIVSYQSQGFTAISLQVDVAADTISGAAHVPDTWGAFGSGYIADGRAAGAASGPGINPNTDTNWAYTSYLGSPAWISVTLVSKTGTGTVSGTLLGWRPHGSNDTAVAPPSTGCPSGPNGAVQFDNSGACGGDSNFTWDNTAKAAEVGTTAGLPSVIQGYACDSTTRTCFNATASDFTGVGIQSTAGFGLSVVAETASPVGIEGDAVNNNTNSNAIGFASFVSTDGVVTPFATNFYPSGCAIFNAGSITTCVEYWGVDLSTSAGTNKYYSWFDSRGVRRVREDDTFDSVNQAIEALYNPLFPKYFPADPDFERIVLGQWSANIAQIGTEAGGTGTLRQTQIIGKSLIIPTLTAATLATPGNATEAYCSDCTVTSAIDNTCTGSGSGANAFRINGAWKCVI